MKIDQFSLVHSLSHVWLFATSWTAEHQASLSTNSWTLLKLISIKLVMPSNHLILCHPLLILPSIFPSIRVFQMSQLFASDSQSIGVSASTSVLPMNIQNWFPLGWTGWIFLQSKGLSWVFFSFFSSKASVLWHSAFFMVQLSYPSWKIPWTEELGRLQSMGLLRVGHNWATSLSCIGEGNGNPLQGSCLESPRDVGAWWAAVYGVAQSRTRLKRLSSSSR